MSEQPNFNHKLVAIAAGLLLYGIAASTAQATAI